LTCAPFFGAEGDTLGVRVVRCFYASVMGKFALYNLTLQFPSFFTAYKTKNEQKPGNQKNNHQQHLKNNTN
jgi:hypothetical protein